MIAESTNTLSFNEDTHKLRVKRCYSATIEGETVSVIKASYSSRGRIQHTAVLESDPVSWQQFIAETSKGGTITIGCIPVQESLTLWLTVPFFSRAKAKKVFPSLLDIQLPFALKNCYYQFLDLHASADKKICALAVAARKQSVADCLKRYHEHGIDPVILDHEGLALWTQSVRELPLEPKCTRIILYLDSLHITVVLGTRERFLTTDSIKSSLFSHSAHEFTSESKDTSTVPPEVEILLKELRRFLYAELKKGQAVEWVMCGRGVQNSLLVKYLYNQLSNIWSGPLRQHEEPDSFLARALYTRALLRAPLGCNLRRGNLIHKIIQRHARRKLVVACSLLLISALLLCAFNISWHIASKRRLARIKLAISQLASELAPNARIPYGMEVQEVKKAMAKQYELMKPFLDIFNEPLSRRLAEIINVGKKCNLKFQTFSLEKGEISIAGTAEDWNLCDTFAHQLEGMGYSVTLKRQEAISDTSIHFTVNGKRISR